MAAAKAYKKKPIDIAGEVVEKAKESAMFSEINAVMAGFYQSQDCAGVPGWVHEPHGGGSQVWSGGDEGAGDHYRGLRRRQRGEASSRGTSALCSYRREH